MKKTDAVDIFQNFIKWEYATIQIFGSYFI